MEKILTRSPKSFFLIDLSSALFAAPFKNTVEVPFFLLKGGDYTARNFVYENLRVTVKSDENGLATIHDRDIWIYCLSEYIRRNYTKENQSNTLQFVVHDYLVATNRRTDGDNYRRMMSSLKRLMSTQFEICVDYEDGTQNQKQYQLFSDCKTIKRPSDDRMMAIEVTFPDWTLAVIKQGHLLQINPEYFSLRKPLERRIYELAKKYCANQVKWSVDLNTMYERSGSSSTFREFRRLINVISKNNKLPDYQLRYLKRGGDILTFYSRGTRGYKAQIRDMVNQLNKQRRFIS